MDDDPYAVVNKSSLKLKADSGIVKKRKKKKELEKIPAKIIKAVEKEEKADNNNESTKGKNTDASTTKSEREKERPRLTKAQLAFQKMQEKRQMERIMEKASKTHKQRVEEFNAHLDSLTEHYDIPKVSWTK